MREKDMIHNIMINTRILSKWIMLVEVEKCKVDAECVGSDSDSLEAWVELKKINVEYNILPWHFLHWIYFNITFYLNTLESYHT